MELDIGNGALLDAIPKTATTYLALSVPSDQPALYTTIATPGTEIGTAESTAVIPCGLEAQW
jgi:hypothetical protein